jgi:hypothetical protein
LFTSEGEEAWLQIPCAGYTIVLAVCRHTMCIGCSFVFLQGGSCQRWTEGQVEVASVPVEVPSVSFSVLQCLDLEPQPMCVCVYILTCIHTHTRARTHTHMYAYIYTYRPEHMAEFPVTVTSRHLAHAEGALYGTELGSVTLKRIGFFCFPIKHSTHTGV